jgi:hypothetical protein
MREITAECGWTVLSPLPYIPDLTLSEFHLFGPMKDGLCGKHFADDSAVIVAIKKWLLDTNSNFYKRGMPTLVQQLRKYI